MKRFSMLLATSFLAFSVGVTPVLAQSEQPSQPQQQQDGIYYQLPILAGILKFASETCDPQKKDTYTTLMNDLLKVALDHGGVTPQQNQQFLTLSYDHQKATYQPYMKTQLCSDAVISDTQDFMKEVRVQEALMSSSSGK
jgi:uncharacterized membrane protein